MIKVENLVFLGKNIVTVDITAPLYWWEDFDSCGIGKVVKRDSVKEKILLKDFEEEDFSFENNFFSEDFKSELLECLNEHRDVFLNYEKYIETRRLKSSISKEEVFSSLIRVLPFSYNQKRSVMMSSENVFYVIEMQKKNEMKEWKVLIKELKNLPFVEYVRKIFKEE